MHERRPRRQRQLQDLCMPSLRAISGKGRAKGRGRRYLSRPFTSSILAFERPSASDFYLEGLLFPDVRTSCRLSSKERPRASQVPCARAVVKACALEAGRLRELARDRVVPTMCDTLLAGLVWPKAREDRQRLPMIRASSMRSRLFSPREALQKMAGLCRQLKS